MRNSLSLLTGQPNKIFASRGTLASRYKAGGVIPRYILDARTPRYFSEAIRQDELTDIVTHTRASGATYVDSNGVLQTAGVNVPRVGHHVWNGSAWVNEGLLHESEARTNLLTYSEAFDDAAFVKDNVSISANSAAAPDGETTADKVVENSSTSFHRVFAASFSVTSGTSYTASVFVKAAERSKFSITLGGANFTFSSYFFDLAAGTASAGAFIEAFAGGYYRCSCVGVASGTGTGRVDFELNNASGSRSYAGDGTSGIYIWGAQLEAGSTPSSYIPTAAAPATRAADVLTIPAANLPWPTPEVIGPELVTNGTFDTDISGWDDNSAAGGSIAWNSSGYLDLINATGTARADGNFTSSLGNVYQVTATNVGGGTVTAFIQQRASPFGNIFLGSLLSGETKTFVFVATFGNTAFRLVNTTTGTTVSIDNISVREIKPLAVSIQMEGRVTFSDTDKFDEAVFYNWQIDGSNRVYSVLRTDSSVNNARVEFWQAAAGVNDASRGNFVYPPGVLVPFNVAARNGSNFVQGSVDGTAAAADTTPVALANLSASNLSLANKYNGTIRTFRMWANDIGDTGIEEASS